MFNIILSSRFFRYFLSLIGLCGLLFVVSQTEAKFPVIQPDAINLTESVFLPTIIQPLTVPTPSPVVDHFTFIETFDGEPAVPEPWIDENWDVSVHLRDQDVLYNMFEMEAHHGPNCEGPPATHTITAYEDTVYTCRNHMMTALYGVSQYGGYGLIYFTPNRLLDTSSDFSIHFDMSTFRANQQRDWIDVWLTPYEQNLQLAIHEFEPDLQGPPQTAVQFRLDVQNRLEIYLHRNGTETKLSPDVYTEYSDLITPSKMMRSTFVIAVFSEKLYVGMPDLGLWWYERDVPDFMRGEQWAETVVQFGHHSYTPDKMCEFLENSADCGPNTYHWDNVILWPTEPFEMVHASPKLITNSTNNVLTLDRPAPAGAKIRFAGVGDTLELSFDNEVTWQNAILQDAPSGQDRYFFRSYWMDIPAGTEKIAFRGTDWTFFGVTGGEWAVRDATVWAKN